MACILGFSLYFSRSEKVHVCLLVVTCCVIDCVSVISSMRLYMDSLVKDYWFESFDMKIVI